MRNGTLIAPLLALGLAACGPGGSEGEEDLRSLEVALASSTSVAQTASIALQAMNGGSACATVVTACAAFPCSGEVSIDLGAGCPLPLGGVASGTVSVTGQWTDATSATMTSQFVNATSEGRDVVAVSATSVVVSQTGDRVDISYVGQDVEVRGEIAVAAQSTYVLEVDTAGTPDDPSDDTTTVTSTQQGVTGTDVVQLAITSAVISPDCRLNPIDGQATLQEVGSGSTISINMETIEFHAACDGQAENLFGGTVDLDFLE
ncbi:MAG: hypothetical protein P1V51_01420 [Deltaproteobacteria bacterium]|nr:hypothetical protein [Deltaproteobacteria bacterium]